MQGRMLLLGLVLAAVATGCPKPADMVDMAAPPDMKPASACTDEETGSLEVGDACDTKKACKCPAPESDAKNFACLRSYEFAEISTTVDLPGGMCSSKLGSCNLGKSDKCGTSGVCMDLFGGGPACMKKCKKNGCRDGYKCFRFEADPTDINSPEFDVCLPPDESIQDCDPTAANQCTSLGGTRTADLTNGNPNAGCLRRGPDNVGLCLFLPCQIGPKNCPNRGNTPQSCYYIDLGQQVYSGRVAGDKSVGSYCFPISGAGKKLDETCQFLNECADNLICLQGKCAQMCFQGTQPTFPGGQAMYKNAAVACPAGTMCKNVFGASDMTNYAGACTTM